MGNDVPIHSVPFIVHPDIQVHVLGAVHCFNVPHGVVHIAIIKWMCNYSTQIIATHVDN